MSFSPMFSQPALYEIENITLGELFTVPEITDARSVKNNDADTPQIYLRVGDPTC